MEPHVDKTLRQQWLTDFVKKQHLSQDCKGTVSYTSSHALHMYATYTIWIIISEKHLSYFRIFHFYLAIGKSRWQSRNLQSFLSFSVYVSFSVSVTEFFLFSQCLFLSVCLYIITSVFILYFAHLKVKVKLMRSQCCLSARLCANNFEWVRILSWNSAERSYH
jgi:hypothetical protein